MQDMFHNSVMIMKVISRRTDPFYAIQEHGACVMDAMRTRHIVRVAL